MKNLEEKIVSDLKEIMDVVKGIRKVWMGIELCADHIGISKNMLRSMISKHDIPFYRIGEKRITFNTMEIDSWIETNCRVKSNAELESDVSTSILKKRMGGVK